MVSVLHVGHTHGGVADPVVDHRVHRHRHAVLGQNLQVSLLQVFYRHHCRYQIGLMVVIEDMIVSNGYDTVL